MSKEQAKKLLMQTMEQEALNEAALLIEFHYGRLLIKQAISIAGPEAHSIVLRRIVGSRDIGGCFKLLSAGNEADNGDGNDAVAVDAAAGAEKPFQKCLLQRWPTDSGISSQGDGASSGK